MLLLLPWAAWLWLGADSLRWLLQVPFARDEHLLNLLLLLAAVALLCTRLPPLRDLARALTPPVPARGPLALLLGAALGHLLLCRLLPISILSSTLFLLGTYGLLGLSLAPRVFRAGLPSVLLLIGVLPFGVLADSYIGTTLRVLTAQCVHDLLSALHIASLPAQTILVLDNGVADIEAACSGLRSLWIGLLGYLTLFWLERRPPDRWFLLGGALVTVLLLAANLVRVTLLVLTALVLGAPALAHAIHTPLGLLGLLLSLGTGALVLRLAPRPARPSQSPPAGPTGPAPRWFAPALAAALLCLAQLRHRPVEDLPHPVLHLPAALGATEVPLTTAEAQLFAHNGARANKWRVRSGAAEQALTGSLLIVSAPGATGFRAHHPPELCLAGAGLRIDSAAPLSLAPGLTLRHLRVHDGVGPRAALYWFQSEHGTTPDLLVRLSRALSKNDRRWLLVSLLLDQPADADDPRLRQMAQALHDSLDESLNAKGRY